MPGSPTTHPGIFDRLLSSRGFDEALVLLFCGLAAIVMPPVALVRLLSGAWLNAAFDAAIALFAVALGIYVWRTRRADLAGRIGGGLCFVLLIAVVYLFGANMLFWAFPATTATFFLLRPRTAACLNLVAVIAIAPQAATIGPWYELATFLFAVLTSNVLAYMFATNMRRSRSRLRTMAERDALTGAGSRYALEPALLAALDKRLEQDTPVSLLVIDIDHFKRVNDTYGHDTGDRVLVEITRRIDHATRAGDHVFRYGGEELVVVAQGAAAEPAGRLAEKLRRHIRRNPFEGIGRISVSIGVAEARPEDTPDTWFRRADNLLYRAKRAGRDRVEVDRQAAAPADSPVTVA